jgi:uncharacterized protein involved in type VI secretion and phage assembly
LRQEERQVMHDELLRGLLAATSGDGRYFGVVCGVVTNNQDPDGMHRVKVRLPWLTLDHESHWARVVAPMAGADRGAYFLPEVDDEVLLAFEHGCLEHPFVVGSLWNGKDKPHENNSDGKNDNRSIRSRSGHLLRLCDSQGDARVEIIDSTGNNRIVIRSQDNSISIEAQGDISIKSAAGKVTIEAATGIELNSKAGINITAQSTLDAKASGQVSVQGTLVKLN